MSVAHFLEAPWKSSHSSYESSVLSIRPAPEFSTAEVVVASLYRAAGFASHTENDVPKAGKEFAKQAHTALSRPTPPSAIKADTWRTVLHGVLESPKQPNQSSKRFLQLCPLVPDAALYSGSPRLSGNSWNPGQLVQRMILLGSPTPASAAQLWEDVFGALSIEPDDDIWARWLQGEFERRRKLNVQWEATALAKMEGTTNLQLNDLDFRFPARQFCRDLEAVVLAKSHMTRRQWISLLESVLRIGSVSHVIWLCRVNSKLWRAVGTELGFNSDSPAVGVAAVRDRILMGESRYLSYGNAALPAIKDYVSSYLSARLGLNLLLWTLEDLNAPQQALGSAVGLEGLISCVRAHRKEILALGFVEQMQQLGDDQARTIGCKKGIGSNVLEFCRHTLGQRVSNTESLRGYDQGYFLRKRGESRNSPWVLSLGPVAVLAMVHCCLGAVEGPRSIKRLSDHLAWYGIEADVDDIGASDLGRNLRMLGLILDSPDAESGMILVAPFAGLSKGESA